MVKKLPTHRAENQREWIEHDRLLHDRERLVMPTRVGQDVGEKQVGESVIFVQFDGSTSCHLRPFEVPVKPETSQKHRKYGLPQNQDPTEERTRWLA